VARLVSILSNAMTGKLITGGGKGRGLKGEIKTGIMLIRSDLLAGGIIVVFSDI
jgi:hypothetical protein